MLWNPPVGLFLLLGCLVFVFLSGGALFTFEIFVVTPTPGSLLLFGTAEILFANYFFIS